MGPDQETEQREEAVEPEADPQGQDIPSEAAAEPEAEPTEAKE